MIHTRLLGFALVGCLSTLIGASPASAGGGESDPIAGSTVELVKSGGTACSTDLVKVGMSEAHQGLAVSFTSFGASYGSGVQLHQAHAFCEVTLRLHPPAGRTYWIAGIESRGMARLGTGATATYRHALSIGDYQISPSAYEFSGPIDQDWKRSAFYDWQEPIYVPCGETPETRLNVDAVVRAGTADMTWPGGRLSLRPASGEPGVVLYFNWASCPAR